MWRTFDKILKQGGGLAGNRVLRAQEIPSVCEHYGTFGVCSSSFICIVVFN